MAALPLQQTHNALLATYSALLLRAPAVATAGTGDEQPPQTPAKVKGAPQSGGREPDSAGSAEEQRQQQSQEEDRDLFIPIMVVVSLLAYFATAAIAWWEAYADF